MNCIYSRTQLRSVRQYLREENQRIAETSTVGHFVLTPEQEEAEFQRCLQENDKWNKEVALIREQRLARELQEKAEYVKERLRLAQEREEEQMEKIEALVRKEKVWSISTTTLRFSVKNIIIYCFSFYFFLGTFQDIYYPRKSRRSN